MSRRAVTRALGIAMALAAEPAAAADGGESDTAEEVEGQTLENRCIEAHVRAQKQRAKLELVEARDSLMACAQEYCPALVRQDCLSWHQEVTVSIPSFVVSATAEGREIAAASVYLDGTLIKPGLDGSAIELNPGLHEVRVEANGFSDEVLPLTARQGEKNRLIQLELRPALEPEPRAQPRATPLPAATHVAAPQKRTAHRSDSHPWVWGSALVAAVAGGIAISSFLDARARFDDAESCRPFCGSGVTDPIRTRLTLATVAGAISVGALGVAGGALLLDASWSEKGPGTSSVIVNLGRRF